MDAVAEDRHIGEAGFRHHQQFMHRARKSVDHDLGLIADRVRGTGLSLPSCRPRSFHGGCRRRTSFSVFLAFVGLLPWIIEADRSAKIQKNETEDHASVAQVSTHRRSRSGFAQAGSNPIAHSSGPAGRGVDDTARFAFRPASRQVIFGRDRTASVAADHAPISLIAGSRVDGVFGNDRVNRSLCASGKLSTAVVAHQRAWGRSP